MEVEAAPTAVILPFSITTTPFSITPWVMVSSLPPFRTTVPPVADAGAAVLVFAGCWATVAITSANRTMIFFSMITGPPYSEAFPGRGANGQRKDRHQ